MNEPKKSISLVVIIRMVFLVVIVPLLPLLISRQWNWWEAWIYWLVSVLGFVISRILAARRNPDLIAERARFEGNEATKDWDKKLAPLVILGVGLIPLVVGIDAVFGSSPDFGLPVKSIALVAILLGYALGSYALIENRFFSAMVRIQAERDHRMVSSGPYRWIRHPGYAGALVTYWATPFFLDSNWAFLPVIFATAVLVIRTRLEDRALQDELEGYSAYARKVRYRLLPGVW